jgi:uncharacterized membrane protein
LETFIVFLLAPFILIFLGVIVLLVSLPSGKKRRKEKAVAMRSDVH